VPPGPMGHGSVAPPTGEHAMDRGLHEEHAILTGGSQGIGTATAREPVREGDGFVIAARNEADRETTA
jgi:NADP-dependent 3-hydroxy acid dehydrogenase YdfG